MGFVCIGFIELARILRCNRRATQLGSISLKLSVICDYILLVWPCPAIPIPPIDLSFCNIFFSILFMHLMDCLRVLFLDPSFELPLTQGLRDATCTFK